MQVPVKSKQVVLNEQKYEVRRLSPHVGSYVWNRLMAAVLQAQREINPEQKVKADKELEEAFRKVAPEERLRGMCGTAFLYMSFQDLIFTQTHCMQVLSRYENDLPMPVMADNGTWTALDLESDPALVNRLTVEVLVFSLLGFLG